MDKRRLEAQLAELPLYRYAFFRTEALAFTDRVREICRTQCPMYGKSWSCPPAVGTPEQCRGRLLRFEEGLLLVTAAEVEDIADLNQTLATRGPHQEITRRAEALVKQQCGEALALSAEACARCESCTYPGGPCRFPEEMLPCVESHCILVPDLAERCGVDYCVSGSIVTWYSLILYTDSAPEVTAQSTPILSGKIL